MNSRVESGKPAVSTENPFSARWVRPGVIPFIFSNGESIQSLLERLRHFGHRGAIVGPHGTGKSTLLLELARCLRERGWGVRMHKASRSFYTTVEAHQARNSPRLRRPTIQFIDGFEALPWWRQRYFLLQSRILRHGLLVTAHRRANLPTLYTTRASIETARAVVRGVLHRQQRSDEFECTPALFSNCRGNVREILFSLYDHYEMRHNARWQPPRP